jgi:hypothetical protein
MHIRIQSIKHFLVVIIIIFTCLAFPIQAIYMSPLPSLIPYLLFAILILFSLFSKSKSYLLQWKFNNQTDLIISIFTVLVILSTLIQFLIGLINYTDVLTAYVIYLFPIFFYVYFSRAGGDRELNIILKTIFILGFINATYYLYDNYNMIVVGEVSSLSLRMHEYSSFRIGGESVVSRIWAFNRGHGLLERHSVSSAWIVLGSFAYLAIKPYISSIKKSIIIVCTLLTLILTMNFTSLVGYILVIALFEINLMQVFYLRYDLKSFNKIFVFIALTFLFTIPIVTVIGNTFVNYINKLLLSQIQLGIGSKDYTNSTYLMGIVDELIKFPVNMYKYPIGFLIGDGFTTSFSVYGKGGDYGIVETLYTFGLPFFLIVMYSLTKFIIKAYNLLDKRSSMNLYHSNYLRFAMCTTLFIIFHEIHMSIWSTKAILPIVFLNLAIFKRYLYSNPRLFLR